MTNFFKIFFLSVGLSFSVGCSQILQDVDLSFDEKDAVEQEDFTVVEKTLTFSESKLRQSDPYMSRLFKRAWATKPVLSLKKYRDSDFQIQITGCI